MQLQLLTKKAPIAVALALVLCLGACSPIHLGDPLSSEISLTMDTSGAMVVTNCDEALTDRVVIEERLPGEGWANSFEFNTTNPVAAGTEFSVADSIALGAYPADEFSLVPGAEYTVQFVDDTEGHRKSQTAMFEIPKAGLSAGEWLLWNSTVSDEACPA